MWKRPPTAAKPVPDRPIVAEAEAPGGTLETTTPVAGDDSKVAIMPPVADGVAVAVWMLRVRLFGPEMNPEQDNDISDHIGNRMYAVSYQSHRPGKPADKAFCDGKGYIDRHTEVCDVPDLAVCGL